MTLLTPLFLVSQKVFFSLAGLLGIGFIIGFHELGHFLFCKMFHIRTPSFSIGFGPKLISKKIGETEFSLSAIPIGGYVEIAGASEVGQGDQREAYASDEHSFARKPWWQKMCVLLGGIAFNLMFAYAALTFLFMAGIPNSGMLYPRNAVPVVAAVEAGSPADLAGIKEGDTIVSIDGQPLNQEIGQDQSHAMVTALRGLKKKANQPATFVVQHDGEQRALEITLREQKLMGQTTGSAGLVFQTEERRGFSILDSLKQGIEVTNAYIAHTFQAFKYIFSRADLSQAGGPLMIISATVKSAGMGFKMFLLLLALISINLAILNLIPVPILDGGQLLFYTIEAIVGRPLPVRVREYIHIASWVAFMALLVWLTYNDLRVLVTPYLSKLIGLFTK